MLLYVLFSIILICLVLNIIANKKTTKYLLVVLNVIPLNDHLSGVVAAEINPPLVAFYVNLTWPYDAIELDMSLVKKGLQE